MRVLLIALLPVALLFTGCASRQRMPIDDRPVLDHSRPDAPPEQPGYAGAESVHAAKQAVYGPGNLARVDSWRARAEEPEPRDAGTAQLDRQLQRATDERQRRLRESDAREMVKENWMARLQAIENMHFAAACGIVPRDQASMAASRVMMTLYEDLARSAIAPDGQLDPQVVARRAADAGWLNASNRPELCSRVTPAQRARWREAVMTILSR